MFSDIRMFLSSRYGVEGPLSECLLTRFRGEGWKKGERDLPRFYYLLLLFL